MKKVVFYSLFFSAIEVHSLENCKWKNEGQSCIIVTETPNTSVFDEKNLNKNKYN